MVFFGIMIVLAFVVFILSPFWLGQGGQLVESTNIDDPERIKQLKQLIVERYILDEAAQKSGDITESEWLQRQSFLANRYIDLSRRFDYLSQNN